MELPTESANVIITDGFLHVVIKHRQAAYDKPLGQHTWALPGGGIEDHDETPAHAGRREAHEETGLVIPDLRHILTFTQRVRCSNAEGGFKKGRLHLMLAFIPELKDVFQPFSSHEIEGTRLADRHEIAEMKDVFSIGYLRMLMTYFNIRDGYDAPEQGVPLGLPVRCPSLGLEDREFIVR